MAEPGNLSPSARNALDESDGGDGSGAADLTREERRQLILAGTSPQLGAPAGGQSADAGTSVPGATALGAGQLSGFDREDPGFFEAASASTGGFPLLLIAALLALTAAIGAIAYRARRTSLEARQTR